MNPRIKQLALQAKQYAHDNEDPDERTSWDFLFETKFAELIVQDCIARCAMMGIANWNNDDISWAVEGCIDNIRSHFGVTNENL